MCMMKTTQTEITSKLIEMGLLPGDTVLIHASIKSIGYVEGGPKAVVKALMDAIGPAGTLVAPAFTFAHEIQENPLFDPEKESSEMGSITEAVRTQPGALRSLAYRHSVSAVGPNAAQICGTPVEKSPFSMEGSFGQMLKLNTKVLMMGVSYTHCTTAHFTEYLNNVPYRHSTIKQMRILQKDGSILQVIAEDYQPKPTADGSYYHSPDDFNKAGAMLEELGKVSVKSVGNAIFRLFDMRDFVDLVSGHFKNGRNVLYYEKGQAERTALKDGTLITTFYLDKAGRDDESVRSVVKEEDIYNSR
jgi:aminoglycoside 3-N-acetyltransferase